MPELPEVETTKASLSPLLGQTVQQVAVYQPRLRWPIPDDLAKLQGQRLTQLSRRAKYIIAQFERDALLLHLGMSGSFSLSPIHLERRKHEHVCIDFAPQHADNPHAENPTVEKIQLRYHDPRRFGSVLWLHAYGSHPLLSKLGVEPLSDAFDAAYLLQKLHGKKTAIKVALMDNAVVVGVGNIYATEALFHTGIHPARPAHTISVQQAEQLVVVIKRILQQSIDLGGSTLRDYVNGQGESGYFQQTLLAYGRAGLPCTLCQTPLQTCKLGQRASAFCPSCQPVDKSAGVGLIQP